MKSDTYKNKETAIQKAVEAYTNGRKQKNSAIGTSI
jgi:hypothetical protein